MYSRRINSRSYGELADLSMFQDMRISVDGNGWRKPSLPVVYLHVCLLLEYLSTVSDFGAGPSIFSFSTVDGALVQVKR